MDEFRERLAFALACELGIPVRSVEEAVQAVTVEWSLTRDIDSAGSVMCYAAEIPYNMGSS